MHDLNAFERRFADRLQAELTTGVGPFDPAQIATGAMVRRTRLDAFGYRVGWDRMAAATPMRRVALALVIVLLVAGLAVAIGAILRPAGPAGPLVILTPDGDIATSQADGTGETILMNSPFGGGVNRISWSPDGRHLALDGSLFEFAIVDTAGVVTYRTNERRWGRQAVWSPDGSVLALLDGNLREGVQNLFDVRLTLLHTDGTVVWVVPLPAEASFDRDLRTMAWSRDGRWIAVTGFVGDPDTGRTWIIDVQGRSVGELPVIEGTTDNVPAWGPEGELYVSRHTAIDGGLWRLDPATGAGERLYRIGSAICSDICGPQYLRGISVSHDGRHIAFVDGVDRLHVVDATTGVATPVTTPEAYTYDTFRWLPGDASVLYVNQSRTGDDVPGLWSLNIGSGQSTLVMPGITRFDLLVR